MTIPSTGDCTAAEDVFWPNRPAALTQRIICVEER
jgi:hypothetical protein